MRSHPYLRIAISFKRQSSTPAEESAWEGSNRRLRCRAHCVADRFRLGAPASRAAEDPRCPGRVSLGPPVAGGWSSTSGAATRSPLGTSARNWAPQQVHRNRPGLCPADPKAAATFDEPPSTPQQDHQTQVTLSNPPSRRLDRYLAERLGEALHLTEEVAPPTVSLFQLT